MIPRSSTPLVSPGPASSKLCAEIGNLEFQISDYRQIVGELSDKLANYETLHGSVFRPSSNPEEKK